MHVDLVGVDVWRARLAERGEVVLDIERGDGSAAGGRDGLAIGRVDDVAGGEDAGHGRARRAPVDPDGALGGEIELAVHEVRARVVADRDEHALERELARRAVDRRASARRRSRHPPPMISATSLFQMNSIFSFANARSCMIFDARSSSRRWMT